MRKFVFTFAVIFLVILVVLSMQGDDQQSQLMRVHIRANSNLDSDQIVKYAVKDAVVEFLTPYLADCISKEQAQSVIESKKAEIERVCNRLLINHGFTYKSKVKVVNEYFPARSYDGVVVDSGYYDALIIELGEGKGDNWWCVVYPPLCFLSTDGEGDIKYKSKIKEWLELIRGD